MSTTNMLVWRHMGLAGHIPEQGLRGNRGRSNLRRRRGARPRPDAPRARGRQPAQLPRRRLRTRHRARCRRPWRPRTQQSALWQMLCGGWKPCPAGLRRHKRMKPFPAAVVTARAVPVQCERQLCRTAAATVVYAEAQRGASDNPPFSCARGPSTGCAAPAASTAPATPGAAVGSESAERCVPARALRSLRRPSLALRPSRKGRALTPGAFQQSSGSWRSCTRARCASSR